MMPKEGDDDARGDYVARGEDASRGDDLLRGDDATRGTIYREGAIHLHARLHINAVAERKNDTTFEHNRKKDEKKAKCSESSILENRTILVRCLEG